jgi:hypothetical protein
MSTNTSETTSTPTVKPNVAIGYLTIFGTLAAALAAGAAALAAILHGDHSEETIGALFTAGGIIYGVVRARGDQAAAALTAGVKIDPEPTDFVYHTPSVGSNIVSGLAAVGVANGGIATPAMVQRTAPVDESHQDDLERSQGDVTHVGTPPAFGGDALDVVPGGPLADPVEDDEDPVR